MQHAHDDRCRHPSPEAARHAVRENIRDYGWHCTGVLDDPGTGEAPFVYTTGLTETYPGQPELVIAGQDPEIGYAILAAAVRVMHDGVRFAGGDQRHDVITGHEALFRPVDLAACTLSFRFSDEYHGRAVPRLQLVWPDAHGRFPGQPGCEPAVAAVQDIGG
jgi:hypothetical protein